MLNRGGNRELVGNNTPSVFLLYVLACFFFILKHT